MAYLRLPLDIRGPHGNARMAGELVSANYFRVLGIEPSIGRAFSEAERVQPGKAPVAIISDRLWRERFGADPGVIGTTLIVGEGAFTVIGVAQKRFRRVVLDWGEPPQIWIPATMYRQAAPMLAKADILNYWGMRSFLVTARLKNGVTAAEAAAEIHELGDRIDLDKPERASELRSAGLRWQTYTLPLSRARFWPGFRAQIVRLSSVLLAVGAGVLLVACFNVATLMLTRGSQHDREVAVRLALGANRRHIARLLLAEGLLVACGGAIAGLLAGSAGTRALASFPRLFAIPLDLDLHPGGRVVVFTAAVAMLCGLAFSLVPVRQVFRLDLQDRLRISAGSARSMQHHSIRGALVATQIALSVILLAGAGLFIRTLRNAHSSDAFLRAGKMLIMEVLDESREPGHAAKFFPEAVQRVRQVPGVRSAVLAWILALSGMRSTADVALQGGTKVNTGINVISPGYVDLAGSKILRGRDFTESDSANAARVAIVNEFFARQYGDGDAVGRQLVYRGRSVTVIGVVRDTTRRSYRSDLGPLVFFPASQQERPGFSFLIGTYGNPLEVVASVRDAISRVDRNAILGPPQTLSGYTGVIFAQERLAAWCLGVFSAIALFLSAVGLYGSIAYSVSQRTAEIGLRMALGATAARIIGMVLLGATVIAGAGAIVGSAVTAVLMGYVKPMLWGASPGDPAIWILVGLLLGGTVVAASILPALRASRTDPALALKAE